MRLSLALMKHLMPAAQLASDMGVGVHVHVAEGDLDAISWKRLQQHASDDWILVHGVLLPDNHQLRGTIVHNPRSNMNNECRVRETDTV